jgi:N6-L-threonylcarbamoyladenine synthase
VSLVLGIETSCDECSAAVIDSSRVPFAVRSLSTFSQIEIHRPYGGIVPEIASRNHLETINEMIDRALSDSKITAAQIDVIAVTNRPGLIGALLVGVSAAKAMAYALNKPLIPVHHLEGHAASLFLQGSEAPTKIQYPCLLAIISGGHTNLHILTGPPEQWTPDFLARSLIGRSRDDAAGEAFDKTAKILGFPYPGGVAIDRESKGGDPERFSFPRALPRKDTLDFSFSGLKTAVSLLATKLRQEGSLEARMPDVCASLQEAIVDALLNKIYLAAREHGCQSLAIVGGVAANSRLRARLDSEWKQAGFATEPLFPKMKYCTDNAAMIAAAGAYRFRQGHALDRTALLSLNAVANPEV